MSRKGLPKDGETDAISEARAEHVRAITRDPRWKRLNRTDRCHMKALLDWHNPLNGYLRYRTRAWNLCDILEVDEETLRRSRKRLIAAGLIVSYEPGTGHRASEYCIARSWAEADEAAALRLLPNAPHFPALVTRTPSAVGRRGAAPADVDEDQDDEETPAELAEVRERYARARRRRSVRGVVPPELPTEKAPELKPWEISALVEADELYTSTTQTDNRRLKEDQLAVIDHGVALARSQIRRRPSTTGAA